MGYASNIPYSILEISCQQQHSIPASTVASDQNIRNLTIPIYSGIPDYAFLDVYILARENLDVNPNSLTNATQWGIKDTSGTFHIGGTCDSGFLTTPGSTYTNSYAVLFGYSNLANYITSGATQMAMFHNLTTISDSMDLKDVGVKLRLYFYIK